MFVLKYYHKDLCVSQGGGRDEKYDIPGKRVGFSYPSSNYFLLENPKNRYYRFKGQANFFWKRFFLRKLVGAGSLKNQGIVKFSKKFGGGIQQENQKKRPNSHCHHG